MLVPSTALRDCKNITHAHYLYDNVACVQAAGLKIQKGFTVETVGTVRLTFCDSLTFSFYSVLYSRKIIITQQIVEKHLPNARLCNAPHTEKSAQLHRNFSCPYYIQFIENRLKPTDFLLKEVIFNCVLFKLQYFRLFWRLQFQICLKNLHNWFTLQLQKRFNILCNFSSYARLV